jgi:3-deoxy-D-manno-octulosonic-acid transferase
MRILYQVGCALLLLAAAPFWLARRGGRRHVRVIAARLGFAPAAAPAGGALWLHAVSVGEVGVAVTLARSLPPEVPLLVTTVTPTGQELARAALAGRAEVDYLPFDLGPPVERFLLRHRPRALVLVEGDYWPLLLSEARRRALPIAVVNGRVGDRSFMRLRRVRPLQRVLFGGIRHFGVQSGQDRDRLLAFGVDSSRVTVTGNLKYDSAQPAPEPELAGTLARLAARRPVLIAGSTMPGEEGAVLDAFSAVGGGERALLVLAPRHPERCPEVEALARGRGLATLRRSRVEGGAGRRSTSGAPRPPDVLLLDTLGELAGLYRHCAAAFIGGTLVATGGHNPLEPARFGVAVAAGPSMHNFRDMAERFDREGAWRRVADAGELGRAWHEWLADPAAAQAQGARAAQLLAASRGALAATLDMLAPLLAAAGGERP